MGKVKSYYLDGIPSVNVGLIHNLTLDGYIVTVAMGLGRAVVSTRGSLGSRIQDSEIKAMVAQAQAKISHVVPIRHADACDEWLAV